MRMLAPLALLSLALQPIAAQSGATITGTVVDSSRRPLEGADIVIRPGTHRARSDSLGRFTVRGLDEGSYVAIARRLGYASDRWNVKLSKDGRLDVRFVLGPQSQPLDTVVVVSEASCSALTLDGFQCRRRTGGGVFLDLPEIEETGVTETADLFRGVPGFRVELQPTRGGPNRVALLTSRTGCIRSLVNGRPATPANFVPRYAIDVSALEIYLKPDSVPRVYQRYTWPADAVRAGRCAVVVYWTSGAPTGG